MYLEGSVPSNVSNCSDLHKKCRHYLEHIDYYYFVVIDVYLKNGFVFDKKGKPVLAFGNQTRDSSPRF